MKSSHKISTPRQSCEESLPVKAGPFGASDKDRCVEWDDGSHLAVERIFLTYTEGYINCIQVEYRDPTGTKLLAPKHGGGGGDTFEVIQLSSAITWISGHYDSLEDKNTFIRSLKFVTKQGHTYGPYGLEHGTKFCFKANEGFCGFHGLKYDSGLRAIGVYVNSTARQHLGSVNAFVNSTASDNSEASKPEGAVEKTAQKTGGKVAGEMGKRPEAKTTTESFAEKKERIWDNLVPKSGGDFMECAKLLFHEGHPYEKSCRDVGLLKAVIKLSMASLRAADAKDIASSVTAVANEKLKAEKGAKAGKKKQRSKKKQLRVDRPGDVWVGGAYDDLDHHNKNEDEDEDSASDL